MELREKYDLLIHTVRETELPRKKQLEVANGLFPIFTDEGFCDHLLTDYVVEAYAYSRSLGLSVEDAANSVRVTATLINKLLQGEGLTLMKFVDLVEAETYAIAEMRVKHLKKIDKTSDNADGMKAAVAFLEKIYPEDYGPKALVTHDVVDSIKQKWEVEVKHVDIKTKQESKDKNEEPTGAIQQ